MKHRSRLSCGQWAATALAHTATSSASGRGLPMVPALAWRVRPKSPARPVTGSRKGEGHVVAGLSRGEGKVETSTHSNTPVLFGSAVRPRSRLGPGPGHVKREPERGVLCSVLPKPSLALFCGHVWTRKVSQVFRLFCLFNLAPTCGGGRMVGIVGWSSRR